MLQNATKCCKMLQHASKCHKMLQHATWLQHLTCSLPFWLHVVWILLMSEPLYGYTFITLGTSIQSIECMCAHSSHRLHFTFGVWPIVCIHSKQPYAKPLLFFGVKQELQHINLRYLYIYIHIYIYVCVDTDHAIWHFVWCPFSLIGCIWEIAIHYLAALSKQIWCYYMDAMLWGTHDKKS